MRKHTPSFILHPSSLILPILFLLLTTTLAAAQTPSPAPPPPLSPAPQPPTAPLAFHVEPAPEWDALFDRDSGWTGADGIYTIPLSQDERAGAYAGTGTFFLFSDTFVGDVAADGSRQNATLVNNSAAFRPAGTPWAQPLQMFVNTDPQSGDPISLFTPAVPGTQPGDFYWLKDAVRLNGTTYVFASWWSAAYARRGIVLITLPPGDLPPFPNHTQQIVPLYLPQLGDATGIVFGGAILPNTAVSGAPQPDGYVYVYGTSDSAAGNGLNKRVYVARVPEADFASAAAWRFWNGSGWVASIQQAAPIADEASVELSVVALPDGRFLLLFQHLQASRRIAIRVGTSPTGPFGPPITIYTCPEPVLRSGIFCYNAKAHPHLSNPGELLISYNVNTTNFADNLRFSDIYRPRFIRLIAP